MKLFSAALLLSVLSVNVFANNCEEFVADSTLGSIGLVHEKLNLKCFGTNLHGMEKKIRSQKKMTKNKLMTNKELQKEYNLLLLESKAVAVVKTGVKAGLKASHSLYPFPFSITLGLTMIQDNDLKLEKDLVDISVLNKLSDVSPQFLIESFEKDLIIFDDAEQKISVLENEYLSYYKEGKNNGWDDVKYLEIKIAAEKAREELFKKKLVYLGAINTKLKNDCK